MMIDAFACKRWRSMTHFKKPSVQNVQIRVLIPADVEFQVSGKCTYVDYLHP